MLITVVGLDPSLSNFGMVKGTLDMNVGKLTITDMQLIETSSINKNKKTVRQNSKDLQRARAICDGMSAFIDDAEYIFVEIPVGSQSARAMASYGISIGILASIGIPMFQVTPYEVKEAATGTKTATKQQMIDWAVKKYPFAPWLRHNNKVTQKNEHLADGIAAIHAGVKTDEFKQVRTIYLNRKTK